MVIKFDLSTIPDNVTINEATLSIYPIKSYYEGENGPKSVFRLTKDWEESSVTWSRPWTTGGGDFEAQALASSTNSAYNVWEDYDITSAVKNMVESGGNNYGFIFKFDSMTPKKGVSIWSSEGSQEANRPKLTITYDPPVEIIPIPKPMTNISVGPYKVSIVNLQGREITSFEIDDIAQLSQVKSTLSSGMHIVNIQTSGKNSFQMKWLIR